MLTGDEHPRHVTRIAPAHEWFAIALAIIVLPIITVVAIWIPFGFSLGGLVEEWGFLELFSRKGVFYIITEATLPSQRARPFHILPQALAFTLDPNSFYYWHIIQATALIIKGICGACIGFYLTKRYTSTTLADYFAARD